MNVIVVGAGLAGPLFAQGLSRAGIDVTLYEREIPRQHSVPRDTRTRSAYPCAKSLARHASGQGYRIHLEPAGDLALRACLTPELYQRVVDSSGKRGAGVRVLDPELNVVHEMLFPASEEDDASGHHRAVDRSTLREILLSGIDVRYGAAFERYELCADNRVRVFFSARTVAEADLLVAADGTYSRIREQLLPHAEITETGQSLIFGKTLLTPESRALVPPAALDGFCAVAGDDGRFMPLAAHEYRCGGADYLMWVFGAPSTLFPDDLFTVDKAELRAIAEHLVADWAPQLGQLIRRSVGESVYATTVRSAKPLAHWDTGPVTLLGDAIHTMIPAGIGAAVALRDAESLCRKIAERSGSLLTAVREYETEMLEYGFAAVEQSLRRAG